MGNFMISGNWKFSWNQGRLTCHKIIVFTKNDGLSLREKLLHTNNMSDYSDSRRAAILTKFDNKALFIEFLRLKPDGNIALSNTCDLFKNWFLNKWLNLDLVHEHRHCNEGDDANRVAEIPEKSHFENGCRIRVLFFHFVFHKIPNHRSVRAVQNLQNFLSSSHCSKIIK